MEVMDWLSTVARQIRWQVLGDLTEAPADNVAAERALVEADGVLTRRSDSSPP
jgi:hypothetical protein